MIVMVDKPDIMLTQEQMDQLIHGEVMTVTGVECEDEMVSIGAECIHNQIEMVNHTFTGNKVDIVVRCKICGKVVHADPSPQFLWDTFQD